MIERIIITGIQSPHFSSITGEGPERVNALYSILLQVKGSKSTMIFYTQLDNILEIGALMNKKESIVILDKETKKYIEEIEFKNNNHAKAIYDALLKKGIIALSHD
jgi:hypothetical protein